MLVAIICVVTISALYIFFAVLMIAKWSRASRQTKKNSMTDPGTVCIIVAFRHESPESVIRSLEKAVPAGVEVILVDDNDEPDRVSPAIYVSGAQRFRMIANEGTGKKTARITGVGHTQATYILFTDADCMHRKGWVTEMITPLHQPEVGMTMGGVAPADMRNFFSLDDLSLTVSSLAAAEMGWAFACSGANMAFRRDDFIRWKPYRDNLGQASGDDTFLMQACLDAGLRVRPVFSAAAVVFHPAAPGLRAFLSQRMRWGSKTGLKSGYALPVGLLVFFNALILWACPVLFSFHLKAGIIGSICLGLIAVVDYLLLFLASRHWGLRFSTVHFVPAFLFHGIYIPWVAILGKRWPVTWKGRRLNSRH